MTGSRPTVAAAVVAAAAWFGSGIACAGAPLAGDHAAQLAAACASCHTTGGGAQSAIVSLAGLGEAGCVQAMLAYRSGQRSSQIMHVVAAALSAQEIAAVAHYLAGRPATAP